MDIQWDNFSKDNYEDIKSIVENPSYLPETGKDFLQNLHKASIRMGAYAAIFDGGTNFTDNFFFDDPSFPNAIEIKIGRIVNSNAPSGVLLDAQDTFSLPITKKSLAEAKSYQDFQRVFEEDLQKNIRQIHRPDLLEPQAADILQKEIEKKKLAFQSQYPCCTIAEPKDQIFYSTLEDPAHPLVAIPKGYADDSMNTHTLSIVNKNLLEATHGTAKATITFPDEKEWSFALYADFSYNGKTFTSNFFPQDELANAMRFLDDSYVQLQEVIEKTERLASLDAETLPRQEASFVRHYQALLREDFSESSGKPTYSFSKLYTMARDTARYSLSQRGDSKNRVLEMLKKYSPGADIYEGTDFSNIIVRDAEIAISH